MSQLAGAARSMTWHTPAVIILCGCLISLIGFGPRSAFGFFLTPMSAANGWGRDVFALAFALQNLLWGIGQPFAGAVADRFGMVRVLSAGGTPVQLALSYEPTQLTGGTAVAVPEEGPLAGRGVIERMKALGIGVDEVTEDISVRPSHMY